MGSTANDPGSDGCCRGSSIVTILRAVDEHLDDVLAELPFNQRAAVVLRFYGGFTTEEIASRAGLRGRLGRPVDQPRAREDAEGPAMTDLEQQLTDHLRRRAAAATPRYDLEGIEQGTDDRRPSSTSMITARGAGRGPRSSSPRPPWRRP